MQMAFTANGERLCNASYVSVAESKTGLQQVRSVLIDKATPTGKSNNHGKTYLCIRMNTTRCQEELAN